MEMVYVTGNEHRRPWNSNTTESFGEIEERGQELLRDLEEEVQELMMVSSVLETVASYGDK